MKAITIQISHQDFGKISAYAKQHTISIDDIYQNFTQHLIKEQQAFEDFQKIAKNGSSERGLSIIKKLQQIHGDA